MPKHTTDVCWYCEKPLGPGVYYVEVRMYTTTKNGWPLNLKQGVYDRLCLDCAIKEKVPGINFENLAACAPFNKWQKQVGERNLRNLFRRSYHFAPKLRTVLAYIKKYR